MTKNRNVIPRSVIPMILVFIIAMGLSFPKGLWAEEVPIVNGKLWTKSSPAEKKAYIVGISNMVAVEYLYQEGSGNIPTDEQTVIQRLYKASENTTLDSVMGLIDQWYARHPDKTDETVLAVIWKNLVHE